VIERVGRGVYKSTSYEPIVELQWENLALTAATIPKGAICLISALTIYELTDEIMRECWIAVSNRTKPPKRPHTRIIRMRNMNLGKERKILGEYKVFIFDRERTIVDSFRFLSKETAIKALQAYLARTGGYKPDLRKLQKYARLLRVDLNPYILALTT
jgi:predicted transcriptional regulator of viral defense system